MLPILLEPTALRSADPYLTALTVLEPKGKVAAETAASVATLSPPPPGGDVLLDEGHGQTTWRRLPPSSRGGYAASGSCLREKLGLSVGVVGEGLKLSDDVLADSAVLVIPIAPSKGTRLSQNELAAVSHFVGGGKGLLVMGTYTGDWHHEANLNEVIDAYGIRFANDSIVASGTSAGGHLYETGATIRPSLPR